MSGPVIRLASTTMIRDRSIEDLDRLCDILRELDDHAAVLAGRNPRDWLQEVVAERSWVFDQAPVHVVPTRNVVGHVQVYPPPDAVWIRDTVAQTGRRADDFRVIGRLYVKPVKHNYGIARYLLRESVQYIETRERVPVLEPADLALVPSSLCSTLGFTQLRTDDGPPHPLVRMEQQGCP